MRTRTTMRFRKLRRSWRREAVLLTVLVALIAADATYAYTSAIGGIAARQVGSGSGSISSYTLGTVTYNLQIAAVVGTNNPNNILSISFPLTGATTSTVVRARLAGNWYSCSSASAPTITCATTSPQATVSGSINTTLQVVASG